MYWYYHLFAIHTFLLPSSFRCKAIYRKHLAFGGTHTNKWIVYRFVKKQGKSGGFDSCNRPSNLTQIGFNHRFFSPCDLEIWWIWWMAPLLHYTKRCASFQSHRWIKNWSYSPERSIRVKIGDFFVRRDLEIWWMTFKNNRAPLLCCFKICASFHSHQWIET